MEGGLLILMKMYCYLIFLDYYNMAWMDPIVKIKPIKNPF